MGYAERWRNAITVVVVASLLGVFGQAVAGMVWASDTRYRPGLGWRGLFEGLGFQLSPITGILLVAVAVTIAANVWPVSAGPRLMALSAVVVLGSYVVVVEIVGFIAIVTKSPSAISVALAVAQWLSGAVMALAAIVISLGYVFAATTPSTSPDTAGA